MIRFNAVFSVFLAIAGVAVAEPKIAVVNVPAVSERYRKTADLEAQFDSIRAKLKQDRDAMQDRLERSRRSLQEELKPGTQEFDDRRKQIAVLEAEIQWFVETEGQRVERGLADSLRSIYSDVQQAVTQLAQEKGLDLVIAKDELPADAAENPNQVKQQILLQKVLYVSPPLDITEEVVARLNATYVPAPTPGAEGKPAPAANKTPPKPAPAKPKP